MLFWLLFSILVPFPGDEEATVMAVFATGGDSLYDDLGEIKLSLNTYRRQETSPVGNTCSASVIFPVAFTSYETFRKHVMGMMTNALDHFGMM